MKIMRNSVWVDLDDTKQVEEMDRMTEARKNASFRKREQRRMEIMELRLQIERLEQKEQRNEIVEEESLLDAGAPGSRIEQMADLMDDDEREAFIAAGMPEDWAYRKEEEFAQMGEEEKSWGGGEMPGK